jgi:hypothetical protein
LDKIFFHFEFYDEVTYSKKKQVSFSNFFKKISHKTTYLIDYKIDISIGAGYSAVKQATMPISKENKLNAQKFCAIMDKLMKCYYENNSIEEYEEMENAVRADRIIGTKYDDELDENVPITEPSIYEFYRNQCDMKLISDKQYAKVRCVICDCVVTKKGLEEHQQTRKCCEIRKTKKFQHAQTNLKTADKLITEKWDGNKLNIEKVSYDGGVLNTASGLRRIIDKFNKYDNYVGIVRINGKPKCVFKPKPDWKIREIVARNCKNAVKKMRNAHKLIEADEKLKIREEKKAIALHNKQERERKSLAFQEKKRLKQLEKENSTE